MSDMSEVLRRLLALERAAREPKGELLTYATAAYTPTYLGAATPGTTTYTTQVGAYTRIGNVVFFTAYVVWTAATGTGVAVVSLPFTSANVTNQRFAVSVFTSSVTFANSGVQGVILPNTTRVQFASPLTNAASTDINVEAAGSLNVTGWYLV